MSTPGPAPLSPAEIDAEVLEDLRDVHRSCDLLGYLVDSRRMPLHFAERDPISLTQIVDAVKRHHAASEVRFTHVLCEDPRYPEFVLLEVISDPFPQGDGARLAKVFDSFYVALKAALVVELRRGYPHSQSELGALLGDTNIRAALVELLESGAIRIQSLRGLNV